MQSDARQPGDRELKAVVASCFGSDSLGDLPLSRVSEVPAIYFADEPVLLFPRRLLNVCVFYDAHNFPCPLSCGLVSLLAIKNLAKFTQQICFQLI